MCETVSMKQCVVGGCGSWKRAVRSVQRLKDSVRGRE